MKWTVTTGLLLTIVGVCLLFTSPSQAQALTMVNISPSTQTVNSSQPFTVGVYIVPGEPISSAQCDLTFNATLLEVNSITQGNLLSQGCSATSGYIEINNSIGKITGIWGSTMAFCTVSNPGTFVNISFTARSVSGTSFLNLSKVMVNDVNTSPVSISVTNGSVTIGYITPGPTITPKPASTTTATPIPTLVPTPTPTITTRPTPTATPASTPAPTSTIAPTATPVSTPAPTSTITPTATSTSIATPTAVPTAPPNGSEVRSTVGVHGANVQTDDGKIEVSFPAGAFKNRTTVSITVGSGYCHNATEGFVVGDTCFSLTPTGALGAPAMICINLSPQDLSIVENQSDIKLGYWSNDTWEVASNISLNGNTLCGETTHLSDWAILGAVANAAPTPTTIGSESTMPITTSEPAENSSQTAHSKTNWLLIGLVTGGILLAVICLVVGIRRHGGWWAKKSRKEEPLSDNKSNESADGWQD